MGILERLQKIRLIAMDLDGVLTNGKILLSEDGSWLRQMDMKDGFAMQLAVKKGLILAVITGSNSNPVAERLSRLGITEFYQNSKDKAAVIRELVQKHNLSIDEILFIGDDIPDLAAYSQVGLKVCPADAVPELKEQADIITIRNGGDACVREIIEKVMRSQEIWQDYLGVSSI